MKILSHYVVMRPAQLRALIACCLLIGLGFGFFTGWVVLDGLR